MSLPTIRTRADLVQEFIKRFVATTPSITWFGNTSIGRAWAESTATLVEGAYLLYTAILRRITLIAASGDNLTLTMAERGTPRLPSQAAKLLVVFRPETANVTAITLGPDVLTVDDASKFLAGDEIRITNGTDDEVVEIDSIAGNDITLVAPLVGTYDPVTESVQILFRVLVPEGSTVNTSTGVIFQTLADVYTGDANPILNGEGAFLGLLDKVWSECTTKGAGGAVDPLSVTAIVTPIRGVKEVFNPEPSSGGLDEESDLAGKYRAMHQPTLANQETQTWIEAMAMRGNADVLRGRKVTSDTVAQMAAKVLNRNGGTFTADQLTAIGDYVSARVRSYMTVTFENVTLTSIEVEASITMDPGATLAGIGKTASSLLAAFLDYRKLAFGCTIDEADLLAIVKNTTGVATLETASFLPATDTVCEDDSLPTLVRLSLRDLTSGDTWNADLAVSF